MFLMSGHPHRGQGLLEVIIGIGVIVAGTVGTITLISSTVQAGRTVSQKVAAASLAREGIEVIRNIRDTNWLRIQANEDVDAVTSGIQLPKSFEGAFDEAQAWHHVVPEFDRIANDWRTTAIDPSVNPVTFDTSCGSAPCSQVFFDNQGFYQDATAPVASHSRFRRLVTLNPICRKDGGSATNPADGIPDVGTWGDTLATETLVEADNSTCAAPMMLVGLKVVSAVCWDDCTLNKTFTLEDRLYNWKYVK